MQILRSWWGMVLLAVIVACSGFLFYTLTVEESVDAVCTLIYEGKEEEAKAKIDTIKDIDAIGSNKDISGYPFAVSHFDIVLLETHNFSANSACVK